MIASETFTELKIESCKHMTIDVIAALDQSEFYTTAHNMKILNVSRKTQTHKMI